jgi:WG containing repeat
MNIRSIASALLLVALALSSCAERGSGRSSSENLELFRFVRNDKLGYIDRSGKTIVEPKFDVADNFSEGLAAVEIGEKFGYIDRTGKMVISPEFERAENFSEGLANVGIDGKSGWIDKTGKLVIPARFDNIARFQNGIAEVSIGDLMGTIDRTGKFTAYPTRSNSLPTAPITIAHSNSDGLIRFEQNNRYGYMDRQGNVIIQPKFDNVGIFSEGLAWVEINKKLGYIDKTGKIKIPLRFDDAVFDSRKGDFDGGLAKVCLNSKCGYIDRTGKIVIPLKFDDVARKFSDGLAWVKIDKRLGYVDRTGKVKISPQFAYPAIRGADGQEERIRTGDGSSFSAKADFDRGLAAVLIPGTCGSSSSRHKCARLAYVDTKGKVVFEFGSYFDVDFYKDFY